MRLTVALLPLFLLLPAPAGAQGLTREAALETLQSPDPGQRQRAAVSLAQVGRMDDVPALLAKLRDPDEDVRAIAERAIWVLWSRSGNAQTDALFLDGIAQMNAGQFKEGIATFSRVIAIAPEFAEGWNKRATAYYLMGELDRSLADCEEVVKRNPVHFGALSGFGLIYLEKDDLPRAAEYFERALAVNPNLAQIEAVLEQIREILRQRRRQSI